MATRYVKNLETFLMKIQDDNETAQTSLLAADYQDVMDGSQFAFNIESTEIATIGPAFDQDQAVPGRKTAELTLVYPLRGFGTSDTPSFDVPLQCCNFGVNQTLGYYVYTPSSGAGYSGTGWNYYGKSGVSVNLEKASNLKGTFKISGESGKIGKIEFGLKGAFDGLTTGSAPTCTKIRNVVPAIIGGTCLITNIAYKVISFEIDGGQEVDTDIDMTDTTGCGQSVVTNRKIKWTAKVYADSVNTLTNPVTAINTPLEDVITIYWGASSDVKIDMTYAQITDCKRSDQNGITTWDLAGQCNRNDFTLSIKAGNSGSPSASPSSSASSSASSSPSASTSSSPSSSASSSTS